MAHPPHLPPKTCNIRSQYRRELLPFLCVAVVISLLSGLAATLATVAWIVPPLPVDVSIQSYDIGHSPSVQALDTGTLRDIRQRVVLIYESGKISPPTLYTDDERIGAGVLLSSDGWIVGHVPYRTGRERAWEAIDAQGVRHTIERVVTDATAQVVYMKLSGSGFRIADIASGQEERPPLDAWAYDGEIARLTRIETQTTPSTPDRTYSFARPQFRHQLVPSPTKGALLFSHNGVFLGVAHADGTHIPSALISLQLPRVLSGRGVAYRTVSVEGFVVHGVVGDRAVRSISGYAVTKTSRAAAPELRVGDVIIRVNGEPFHPVFAPLAVLGEKETFALIVLRGEAEIPVQMILPQAPL